jgi:hypothetical protein
MPPPTPTDPQATPQAPGQDGEPARRAPDAPTTASEYPGGHRGAHGSAPAGAEHEALQRQAQQSTVSDVEPEPAAAPQPADAAGLEERIRAAAYALSEQRGFAPGHEREDWLAAERQLHGGAAAP